MITASGIDTKVTHLFEKEKYWDCWKLKTRHGRQTWQYEPPAVLAHANERDVKEFIEGMMKAFEFDKKRNPNSGDRVYRSRATKNFHPLVISEIEMPARLQEPLEKEAFLSAVKALHFYNALQAEEGHWPGDYGGPLFLLPGLIIASFITENPFPIAHRALMTKYMLNHQNEDGGWGLHIEGNSTMFGTVMQYVALRLLGLGEDDERLIKAREWIQKNGGATGIPSWGKFYLAVLGVFDWEGCNSLLPEMWLLPKSLPIHPSRYWCHSRMVYLPMAYCYGHRITGNITPLIIKLRKELYPQKYETIQWEKVRNHIASTDSYTPQTRILKILNTFVNRYEKIHSKALRQKALAFILEYVHAEDEQTNYVDIGPVNQIINSICVWHAYGNTSPQFRKHAERWNDYLWVAEDGMKMNGYNGSQLWDTAFAAQAITEAGLDKYFPETVRKAYHYINITQVQEDVPQREKFFRHLSKGGWPFSTLEHGWPISDCTAEGLSATLKLHGTGLFGKNDSAISDSRLFDAVNIILSFQNDDGGWATYENTRSAPWLELLNPSEVFGNIMIDYSYTECTSACVRALCEFRKNFPHHRADEVSRAVKRGI
ncbi:MAG TPA: prenyltransferase/squalene oxidase repeat-containing protein, partial [Chitinophagales bacterium]|nr:prenyltransferase/squalene oxidase repeat-containing protein [Chitinophagales bacterium]